jgi:hypothetical protein
MLERGVGLVLGRVCARRLGLSVVGVRGRVGKAGHREEEKREDARGQRAGNVKGSLTRKGF